MKIIRVIKASKFNKKVSDIGTKVSKYIIKDIRSNFPQVKDIKLELVTDWKDSDWDQYITFSPVIKSEKGILRQPNKAEQKPIYELEKFLKSRPYTKLIKINNSFKRGVGYGNNLRISIYDCIDDNPAEIAKNWADFLDVPFSSEVIKTNPSSVNKNFQDQTFYFEYYNSDDGEWEDMELTVMQDSESGKFQWIEGDGAEESGYDFDTQKQAIQDYKQFVKSLGNKVKGL